MASAQHHFNEAERLLVESKKWHANSIGAGTLATQASVHVQLAAIILAAEIAGGSAAVLDTRSAWAGEQR